MEKWKWFTWRRLLWSVLALCGAGLVALGVAWWVLSRDVEARVAEFAQRAPRTLTKVLDRHGELLGVFAQEHREVIPYGEVPRAFVGAVLATEDAGFMHHRGVSGRGVLRAGLSFVTSCGRRREGASTLTMQLVRAVTARRQRRLDRKLKEIILARRLEQVYTKKEIFEQYANEVYFGGGRYGLEAAARFYFGKSAPGLAVEECALLAGLIQNPNGFNPFKAGGKARDSALQRRNHVLRRMAAEGFLKDGEARGLMERPIRLARESAPEETVAPHALEEVRKHLYQKYGRVRALEGGLEVTTTLDAAWQRAANDAVRAGLADVNRRRGEAGAEGALLAVEPQTGEIRALVGGHAFSRSKFNRAFQARRQPGSTMKPFIYGAAFTHGMTPATIVEDVRTRFLFQATAYQPGNYDRDFWGPIPIWEAVRGSRNLPTVHTLEAVGIDRVIAFAQDAGLEGRFQPFPSLALGASETTLREMVRGYATFALGGRQAPPSFLIKKVVDRDGKVLETHEGSPGEQVLDPMSTYQVVQCLQGAAQRGTGSRSNALGWTVAGKTGTTNDFADAWFLGFSTRIACGVWVGLDVRRTIFQGADGGRVALPIWVEFMKAALPGTPREAFPAPDGMAWAQMDRVTGRLATGATADTDRVHLAFKPGTCPGEPSTSEAIQVMKEAQAKAAGQAVGIRPWGDRGGRGNHGTQGTQATAAQAP